MTDDEEYDEIEVDAAELRAGDVIVGPAQSRIQEYRIKRPKPKVVLPTEQYTVIRATKTGNTYIRMGESWLAARSGNFYKDSQINRPGGPTITEFEVVAQPPKVTAQEIATRLDMEPFPPTSVARMIRGWYL